MKEYWSDYNMVKPSYQVEGLHCDTLEQAEVLAARFYTRYDGSRDIVIYEVDHHGDKQPVKTLKASKDYDDPNADTEDWIDG